MRNIQSKTPNNNSTTTPPSLKINWEPFFLNRDVPAEGVDLMTYLSAKYGPAAVARFSSPGNPLDVAGSKVGITFDKKRLVIRTSMAHCLVEWVKSDPSREGTQDELMELMFDSYFVRGRDLSRVEELMSCVRAVGLNETEARSVIEEEKFLDVVNAKDGRNKRRGISGVPFFEMGGYRFSGAQPPEVLEEILESMLDEM